jgi:proteasome lid subunit RPN8/RPN11
MRARRPEREPGPVAGQAPRVILSDSMAVRLLAYLRDADERERGGVLLGRRDGEVTWVTMAVFPPQVTETRIECSFDVGCMGVLNAAKDRLDRKLKAEMGTTVGWVHSHPRYGLFLSPTDMQTLSSWRQLDPRAIAIVADPYLRAALGQQIGCWDSGPAHFPLLDSSGTGFLRISQVAEVAEAINDSAAPDRQWDIVTAKTLIGFTATPSAASPRPGSRSAPVTP